VRHAPTSLQENDLPLKKKKLKDEGLFVLGTALPKNGACNHYRKSYRCKIQYIPLQKLMSYFIGFRFPCCGKVYPCDTCHEESNNDGHEMKWANRMICGFCSKEQPYSQKPCVCGKELVRKNGSGFWEGGKGTRSKTLMSRRDTKKYKGTNKTVSMKSSRVGAKK
jgi:uncharacterized CHY-type Zn-finger protein